MTGKVFYDPGDRALDGVVEYNRFADDVGVVETRVEKTGILFGKNDLVGLLCSRCGRAGEPGIADEVEIVVIRQGDIFLFAENKGIACIGIGDGDPCLAEGTERGHNIQACHFFFRGAAHRLGQAVVVPGPMIILPIGDDAINTGSLLFEVVKAEVVLDEQEDDKGGADADGETEYIDKRKGLVPPEAAEGHPKVILKHSYDNGYAFGHKSGAVMLWAGFQSLVVAAARGCTFLLQAAYRYGQCRYRCRLIL